MPFGLKIRSRTRRYNVLSKNYFVTRIRMLSNDVIECTLSVESTGQECLEAVAQRLELRETHYFGLWFHTKSQSQRWVDLEKALKKQLDKFGSEPMLFFGVMFYLPSVSRLQQEVTRYQYYLQVKEDVLRERLHCTVEQGIRLAGLAVQADFGDYSQFVSQDFLREYVLFPVSWAPVDKMLEEWTQAVAEEHKSHCHMPQAEAELLYIKEVEKLDGFGQESFPAKDNYTNDIIIGVSFIGVFVKHRNGRSIMLHRWKDIGTIGHNKSAITVEITSRDDTIMFHMEDMEMAKYIARLFTARHKFYRQNKISAEPSRSPVPVRRRHTWNRASKASSYTDHYQDRQGSQDSIFHDDPYCKSESSLDRCPVEFGFPNGSVHNGSMCSTPSVSSLNRSQTFLHSSPMSSNLCIPGSELMRPDYIPNHRHSAIIAPSYRPTPDYDAVMRQKPKVFATTPNNSCHSQSLRSLNITNTHVYQQPQVLVYSQPEMRKRGLYVGPNGTGRATHSPFGQHMGPLPSHSVPGIGHRPGQCASGAGNGISHTVSTPELANTQQQGANGRAEEPSYITAAANMLRNYLSRPPPPYPTFRPATSTPDLAGHRQRCMGNSSPELVMRKVQLSVKTFQPDSSTVMHQSLQEVSAPLMMLKHCGTPRKRHSVEVVGGQRFMETHGNVALPRRNTSREQAPPAHQAKPKEVEVAVQKLSPPTGQSVYQHEKTLSNVTMFIHSSESEEEDAPDLDVHIPGLNEDISAQYQAALANIPNKPPPEYPGSRQTGSTTALRHPNQDSSDETGEVLDQTGLSSTTSVSEPDLTCVKERVRKEPVKERPVSEMFSIEDSIVEREIAQRSLEKQKMEKRPLMMAALNGLYVTHMPAEHVSKHTAQHNSTDEWCQMLELKLEEERLFTEYEQIPKKKAKSIFTTATLPDNIERNRFRDVLPYEENRVELVPNKENNTGYINASHIKVTICGEEWHYIATQGPLPNTCHDFWQMIWEQGVSVIAMVTAEEEGGRSKSHRYWPKLGSKHNSATHGKFKVTTKFRTDSGCYATTGLKVKHLLSGQERTVWHLQYTDWPEHGCPEYVQGFLSYLEEIQSVRRHTNSMLDTSKSLNPPVIVHCSAGVSRTGVVILTELMISCLEHNQRVEVAAMLGRLRQQRMLMVQTVCQYKFVYQVLVQFLKHSRLI
ncbi:Tyrosine-protein phosphatase non-receptor type 14 [Triplophysa tibetana]|uniref:Tyrosine-protein phosphatase non-receptor type n=1 Tax=Triplophysa tibetana TaxID=1572043 RepID=A0A5A9NG42_9TELE|nr:Tyrosine-protein phosphatase non-receptor type 14 [Triplophysa tibetana]